MPMLVSRNRTIVLLAIIMLSWLHKILESKQQQLPMFFSPNYVTFMDISPISEPTDRVSSC